MKHYKILLVLMISGLMGCCPAPIINVTPAETKAPEETAAPTTYKYDRKAAENAWDDDEAPLGLCPVCGAKITTQARTPAGPCYCVNGHTMPLMSKIYDREWAAQIARDYASMYKH